MSKVYIRRVGGSHYITNGHLKYILFDKRVPKNAMDFMAKHNLLTDADGAIIATCDGKLVGFFRYYFYASHDCADYQAAGTWVAPSFRRKGIGSRMWSLVLKNADDIDVVAGSRYGVRFLNKLSKKHDTISF